MRIKQNKDSWINLKPRVRMLILYNYANVNKALVVGTSNKTEENDFFLSSFTIRSDYNL